MEQYINEEDWENIVVQGYPMEFGWIGVDAAYQVGYFSTYNRAWMPQKVVSSHERYLQLAALINDLPDMGGSRQYTNRKGMYSYWHDYSRKGLIAYDYSDAHRKWADRLNQYDLITVPENGIDFLSIQGVLDYRDIIPKFNITFGDDIGFDLLQAAEGAFSFE